MTKILINGVGVPRGTLLDPRIDAGGGGGVAPKVVEWEWDFDQSASNPFEDFQLRIDDTGEILWYMSTDPLISSEGYLIATYTSEPGKLRVRLLTYEAAYKNISFRPYPEGQNSLTNGRIVENNTFSLVEGWWKGTVEAGAPAVTLKLDAPLTDMSNIQVSGVAEGLDSGGSFYIFVTVNSIFKATEVFIEGSQNYNVVLDVSSLVGSPGDAVIIRANNAGQDAIVNATFPGQSVIDTAKISYTTDYSATTPASGFLGRNNDTGEEFSLYDLRDRLNVALDGYAPSETQLIYTLTNADASTKNIGIKVTPEDQNMLFDPVALENNTFVEGPDGWVNGTLGGRDMTPSIEIVDLPVEYASQMGNTVRASIKNLTNISLEIVDSTGLHAVTDLNRTVVDPFQQIYEFNYLNFTSLSNGPITVKVYGNGVEDIKTSNYNYLG